MCDYDHGCCYTCCTKSYKLRKRCRAGNKAGKNCDLSFSLAHKVTEKDWVCGECTQKKETTEMRERRQKMERMEKVRKAMEIRKAMEVKRVVN